MKDNQPRDEAVELKEREGLPLSPEDAIHRLRHILQLLDSIDSAESPLPKARVLLRGVLAFGIANTRIPPATSKSVDELAREVWDEAIAVSESCLETISPSGCADYECEVAHNRGIEKVTRALEAARDRSRSGEQSDGVDTWCDDCRGFTHALNCPSKERYPFAEQEKE